jgi:hypothetical protein
MRFYEEFADVYDAISNDRDFREQINEILKSTHQGCCLSLLI